jgi:hypothetical protein
MSISDISAKNKQYFHVEPMHVGGAICEIELLENNFEPETFKKKRIKSKPTSYLIVGFDTEYQSRPAVTQAEKKAGAKNELLSYQFCARRIDKDGRAGNVIEVDGIIVPESGKRLPLEDFITIAAGSLVKKYPDILLPRDVLLVGHFTRADFPMFEGFQEKAKGFTANVRSTFVTLKTSHRMIVQHTAQDGGPPGQGLDVVGSFSVTLRDTILLAPANAKALADIGEIIGTPKIELHSDPAEEQRIKENMADFMRDHWPEFREYAIQDARICVDYAERIIRRSQKMFDEFLMPLTLTSFGTKQVLKTWKEEGWDRLELIGREQIDDDRKYSKKKGRYLMTNDPPFIAKVHFEEAFITECYHGGRNEQFVFGPAPVSDWRDLDLSSAYTTAMSLIGKPDWSSLSSIASLNDVEATDLSFFQVTFEFPDTVQHPTLPVRTANGIIFPRKGESYCGAPEIIVAQALGAKLDIVKAVNVPTDASNPIFKPFISQCILERSQHPKGSFDNLFMKEVGNSTYGKTAQGLRARRVYDLRDDDMKSIGPSKLTQPFFAAFITSFTRAVLGETLNALPNTASVFSATTDGFLSDATDADIGIALERPLAKIFRDARFKLVGNDETLEEKHRIRQPIGWRTRGSATLLPGDKKNGIVLQKGGIKTKGPRILEAENIEIIELFLSRTSESVVTYTTGVGIKDMMHYGTDFVFREVEKTLAMEFDWKRYPVDPRDIKFKFNGQSYALLGFETRPLEDINEFRRMRNAWESYNKGKRRILKTKKDFDQFLVFVQSGKMDRKSATYISQEDGDLKRARRDLLRAYRTNSAGFDLVKSRIGKFKHSDMASLLTRHGIPCTVTNIDNERAKAFVPNQMIRTPRVENALRSLQRDEFPELDIEQLLAVG